MEYLELQSVIRNGAVITDVETKNNRTYFRVDGHLFSTFSYMVHHEKHYAFEHVMLDIWARKHNTAEGIEEEEKNSEESSKQFDLFMKHKPAIYKLIFLKGLELMMSKGDKAMIDYIDYHFDIVSNGNNCDKLIAKLEK